MKKRLLVLIAVLTLLTLSTMLPFTGFCAEAQYGKKAMRVGFVDVKKVFDSCTATQKATLSLKKEIDARQEALQREEGEIARLQREYQEKEVVLSASEKSKRKMEIEARVAALQKEADQARQDLMAKERQMTDSIIVMIKGVIVKIAEAGSFDLILEKESILYGKETIDLTEKVVEELNKQK